MPLSSRTLLRCSLLAIVFAPAAAVSCARASHSIGDGDDGGPPPPFGSMGGGSSGSTIVVGSSNCTMMSPCTDFSVTPVMDTGSGAPSSDPSSAFNSSPGTSQGGPCLAEPADGALYPMNWLRPRVLWSGLGNGSVYEVRIHSDAETHDLVVYTTNTYWVMDLDLWHTIAWAPPSGTMTAGKPGSLVGGSFKVTVRGLRAGSGTPVISNSATVNIAPALADGALIYWTTDTFSSMSGNTNTTLKGFHVGDEGTSQALLGNQVAQPVRAQPFDGGNLNPYAYNGVFCIGCHTASPDGKYVSFVSQWPWAVALASVEAAPLTGTAPPWMTSGAISNLSPNINGYYQPPTVNQVMMGIQTFSPAHYKTGDRRLVASIGAAWNQTGAQIMTNSPGSPSGVTSQLAWFDLEWTGAAPTGAPYNPWGSGMNTSPLPLATPCVSTGGVACATQGTNPMAQTGGWGLVSRNGDTNSAGAPSWSHNADGQTDVIAYSSTNFGTKDGRMDCEKSGSSCTSDVYLVQYNNGLGGQAIPLHGASDSSYSEYYPAFSPDDQLVAFNRVNSGTSMYNEQSADIYVVPYNGSQGGTAVPLTGANTPVACTGVGTGQAQNTWPKWAPNPIDSKTMQAIRQKDQNGNYYYWVTFSSIRNPLSPPDPGNSGKRRQQLYVVGITVGSDGKINGSWAPIYLWNQDYNVNNLIPAWGDFTITGTTPPPMPTAK